MRKRLLDSPLARRIVGRIVGAYMALIDRTTSWREIGRAEVEPYLAEGRPLIIAVWHGRLMQMHKCWPKAQARNLGRVLISQSREGEIVAAATAVLGYDVIRGSSAKRGKTKGAVPALREILGGLRSGETVALTPDGPRGPGMTMTAGVVQLARMSGAPVMPFAWATRARVSFRSWDAFVLPLPFSRGVIAWGEAVAIGRELDDAGMERVRAELEAALNRLTAAADAAVR